MRHGKLAVERDAQNREGMITDSIKLLYTSDLHGSGGHYARLVAAVESNRPDILVLGGDMLPDDSALNPKQMGVGQPAWVRGEFREHVRRLRSACDGMTVLIIFGNHDWISSTTAMRELAEEGLLSVLDLSPPGDVGGLHFIGYPYTPPTPHYVKDFERLDRPGDVPPLLGGARWDMRFGKAIPHAADVLFSKKRPSMTDDLAELNPPKQPWVFVAHAPPYGSGLDASFKGEPWGSHAVLETIRKHQPMLSLHGHVHEAATVSGSHKQQIGKTIAVNPGQTRGALNFALIDIDVAASQVGDVLHGHQS